MNTNQIKGVKELTSQECAEINGGGWYVKVHNPILWLLELIMFQKLQPLISIQYT